MILGLVVLLLANHRSLAQWENGTRTPVRMGSTIADELLSLEVRPEENAAYKKTLDLLIEAALQKFQDTTPFMPETERDKATRFFKAVDQTLTARHIIFPPNSLIDLLKSALTPRKLTEQEYHMAARLYPNLRRMEQINQGFKSGETFYYMDCDLTAIVYVAAGERAGFPVEFVEVPLHTFVRWSSPGLKMNWDTNDACIYTDEYYAKRWHITDTGRKNLGWLRDMSSPEIRSYWWCMIGFWHKRHDRYKEEQEAFRAAVKASPGNLYSMNVLAWFLATCPDARLRNGKEAIAIAQKVTKAAPSSDWISTLAAAQAENGDFNGAILTEEKAMEIAMLGEQDINDYGNIPLMESCIQAYTQKLTYCQAVKQGLVEEPIKYRPYDD